MPFSVSSLIKHKSDHFPILIDFLSSATSHASQFKFFKIWTLHHDCKRVVTESWNDPIVCCPMFVLSQKLKNLKLKLKDWNHRVFGNIRELVKKAESKLSDIQTHIDVSGFSEDLIDQQK